MRFGQVLGSVICLVVFGAIVVGSGSFMMDVWREDGMTLSSFAHMSLLFLAGAVGLSGFYSNLLDWMEKWGERK